MEALVPSTAGESAFFRRFAHETPPQRNSMMQSMAASPRYPALHLRAHHHRPPIVDLSTAVGQRKCQRQQLPAPARMPLHRIPTRAHLSHVSRGPMGPLHIPGSFPAAARIPCGVTSPLSSSTVVRGLSQAGAGTLSDDLKGTSIFLVGMMGSGKSTVGRILADALGYFFFDSDEVIEQAAGGATVTEIFEENGEDAFRDLETKVLSELSQLIRLVVSTGGGSVIRKANWSYMQHGITVFIDVPVQVLASRVVASGTGSRPLLSSSLPPAAGAAPASEEKRPPSSDDAAQEELSKATARLQGIYSQRYDLYRNADATVSLQRISNERGVPYDTITADDIAAEVLACIGDLISERKERDEAIRARAG